jgi:hypothetical protein
MLEAIVLLLALATCALIIIAFGPRPARDAPSQKIGWFWFSADRCRE